MPIPAYDIEYLEAAQKGMGALFDVALNGMNFSSNLFHSSHQPEKKAFCNKVFVSIRKFYIFDTIR